MTGRCPQDEAIALAEPPGVAGVNDDAAAIDLGLTSAIVDDIDLPTWGPRPARAITWTTSDPAVVTAGGVITRPALGQPAATATLTAKSDQGPRGGHARASRSRCWRSSTTSQSVARDTDDLVMVGLDDIRGNITLPAAGQFGSAITWSASTPIITPTGEVSRPAYGRPDVPLTLTATLTKGAASRTKSFPATVKAMPRSRGSRALLPRLLHRRGPGRRRAAALRALHRQQRPGLGGPGRRQAVAGVAAGRSGPARPVHHPLARRRHLLHDRHGPELVQPQPRLPDQRLASTSRCSSPTTSSTGLRNAT